MESIKIHNRNIHDYFIDLFCGAGGTTTGIDGDAYVIACINHDKNAILSHAANHPETIHFTEDIRTIAMQPLIDMVKAIRLKDSLAKIHLWASLECTNHSIAKGGMSRDADSRTLAEHLFRYLVLDPDMIWIENVREFKDWGPLRIKSKNRRKYSELIMTRPTKKTPAQKYVMVPDKRFKGQDYNKWIKGMESYGYQSSDMILNAADHGCDTSRRRLFIQFAKPNMQISWPNPTHDKSEKNGLLKWRPVRPLLDLEDAGKSIFEKDIPYAEASLERMLRGLKKFVRAPFMMKYYGHGDNTVSLDAPCPTLTVKDRMYFIKSDYSSGGDCSSIESPCPSLLRIPKQQLMEVNFLIDHQYKSDGNSIDEPCPTLIARQDKKPKYLMTTNFLLDHQFNNTGSSINKPCPALTADRHRKYLATAINGATNNMKWIFDKVKKSYRKSKAMAAIIEFMIVNGIKDIKIRALKITEMLKITGFPETYTLIGTITEQKKYIGNAVPVLQVKVLIRHSISVNRMVA